MSNGVRSRAGVLRLAASGIAVGFALYTVIMLCPGLALANQPPVANAGPDRNVFLSQDILLQGSATDPDGDPIVSWLWTLESAPVGSTAPVSPYEIPHASIFPDLVGDYVLSLVVSDGMALSAPDTMVLHVSLNLPPVAVIQADVISGEAPLTVHFDGSQSYDPEGVSLFYQWNLGDYSDYVYEPVVTHTFQDPGTYLVNLKVRDDFGQSDYDYLTINVTPATNQPPVANAGPDQSIYLNQMAVLNSTSSDPDGDPIVSWLWTIESAPAGSTAQLSQVDAPVIWIMPDLVGDYVFSLVVGDGMALSAPDTMVLHVSLNLPPVAVIRADVTSGEAPLTVHFDGSQSYDPEGVTPWYQWNFGDYSDYVYEPVVTHTFQDPGTYFVALAVTDDFYQYDIDFLTIQVDYPTNDPPDAAPTADPASGVAPLAVQFMAHASDPDADPLTFAWDFGDGGTSTEENPSHTYVAPGTFAASLIVSDGALQDTSGVTVRVTPAGDAPPELQVSLSRDVLWPPNHRLSAITATVTVRDDIDPAPEFELVSITSDEPDDGLGDGDQPQDIQGAAFGTPDVAFQLRSERQGTGDGRVYTIVYRVSDSGGNETFATVTVVVPHDRSGSAATLAGIRVGDPKPQLDGETYSLAILSAADFEARSVDPARALVGNHLGVIAPTEHLWGDVNRDGREDLQLVYDAASTDALAATLEEGLSIPVGLHYETVMGDDYWVPDVYALGPPVPDETTGVGFDDRTAGLGLPWPNPSAGTLWVAYAVGGTSAAPVEISVYSVAGLRVRTLTSRSQTPGRYSVTWDGRDDAGTLAPSGVYFIRAVVGRETAVQRVTLMR